MRLGETTKIQAAINVTPLVDVVLVLLIIFMVMAPHMRQGPDIKLPETLKPKEQGDEREAVVVTVDEHGGWWVDDKAYPPEGFADGLRAAAAAEPDSKIVIRGDGRLNFGEVRHAMQAIEAAGFHGVGLIADRTGGEARKE